MTFLERPMSADSNDVILWRGSGISGANIANEGLGGSSFDLTSSGASVRTATASFWDAFDPNNSEFYKSADMAFGFSLAAGLTMSCWALALSPGDLDRVMLKQNNSGWTGSPIYPVAMLVETTGTLWQATFNTNETISAARVNGMWTHLGVTVDAAGTTGEFFVNGSSVGTTSISGGIDLENNDGPWCLGGRTTTDFFGGKLWDARVASTVRSAAWFRESYLRGKRFL